MKTIVSTGKTGTGRGLAVILRPYEIPVRAMKAETLARPTSLGTLYIPFAKASTKLEAVDSIE